MNLIEILRFQRLKKFWNLFLTIDKKHNFAKEEATGWEIGVYDVDKKWNV